MPSVAEALSPAVIGPGLAGVAITQPLRQVEPLHWHRTASQPTPVYRRSVAQISIVEPKGHNPMPAGIRKHDYKALEPTHVRSSYSPVLREFLVLVAEYISNRYGVQSRSEMVTQPVSLRGDDLHPAPIEILSRMTHGLGDSVSLSRSDWERLAEICERYVERLTSNSIEPALFGSFLVSQPKHLSDIEWMKESTGLSDERLASLLGVSRRALNDWREGTSPEDVNRIRIFHTREILERAQDHFPTKEALSSWLLTPDPVLGVSPEALFQRSELDQVRGLALMGPTEVEWIGEWPGDSSQQEWLNFVERPF